MGTSVRAKTRALAVVAGADADAVEIGRVYRLAKGLIGDSARYLHECGCRLRAKRATLNKRGEWQAWLNANADALGFESRQTAWLLIKGAERKVDFTDETKALEFDRKLWGNTGPRGTQGTGENEWHTPDEYLDAAREVLGPIDLDPASCTLGRLLGTHYPHPGQWAL